MKVYSSRLILVVALVGTCCVLGLTSTASLLHAAAVIQPCASSPVPGTACPVLSLRSPGMPRRLYCRPQLSVEVNGGRPVANTCLLEGFGFTPGGTAHLNYSLSISYLGVTSNGQQEAGAARRVSTPMPYVQCLMRRPILCHTIPVDAHGRFGPVWVRFRYLLGDVAQVFTVHAYGGPHERANVDLPWSQVLR